MRLTAIYLLFMIFGENMMSVQNKRVNLRATNGLCQAHITDVKKQRFYYHPAHLASTSYLSNLDDESFSSNGITFGQT